MMACDQIGRIARPRSIRAARRNRGLSMFALARLAGVDRATVHRIEQGKQAPTTRTLILLRRVLDDTDHEELELARANAQRGSRKHLRDVVPFEHDPVARYATAVHPDGLEVDQVAAVLGLSPTIVDVTQARAIGKLVCLSRTDSPEGETVRVWLARILEARDAREQREGATVCVREAHRDG